MRNYKKLREEKEVLGAPALDGLIEYYRDRFEPSELIEHLGISFDDLQEFLEDWISENTDAIMEDLEHITDTGEANG